MDFGSLLDSTPIRYTLPNGLTVLFKEDHSTALASIQLWVKTGSIHEGQFLGTGISHYLEHMLFKGTKRRSFQAISEEIHSTGGQINAYTTFDRTVYYIDTLSESAANALDVLSDIVFHSTIAETECTRERDVILREIDMYLDDPDQQLSQGLFETAYRQHPYRYPIIGLKERFQTLTPTDLQSYYQSRYVPNNAVLVVVGDLTFNQLEALVDQYFKPLAAKALAPVVVPEEPLQLAQRTQRLYGDYNLVRGSLAYKIPHLSHPDAPILDLLANVLGQGQSSILWSILREEEQLVHDISSSTWTPGAQGLFCIQYTCDADDRIAVEERIQQIITSLSLNNLTASQLQKSVRQIFVSEVNARKTMSGQASRLGGAEVIIGDLNYPKSYLERLPNIQPQDLLQAAHTYLTASRLTLTSLEPSASRPQLASNAQTASILPDFQLHTLANGVRIALQPSAHFPKVSMRATLLGGPLYESLTTAGITGLLSTLLTKDTHTHTAAQIASVIESVGGSFGEFAGNNSFGFALETLPSDLSLALELLTSALTQAHFQESTFQIEKTSQISQLREEEDDILEYGRRILRQRFFGTHPYQHSALGTIAALESLNLQSLQAHFSQLVVGPNLVITVAGDFDPKRVLQHLESHLGTLPNQPLNAQLIPFHKPAHIGQSHHTMDREQAVLFQAYSDCGVTHPLYDVGSVLDEIFSGLSSNLFSEVREQQGLAYYVGSSRLTGIHTGMFHFYAGTHPSKVNAIYPAITAEVARIHQGHFKPSELERCKTRLKSSKRMNLQTSGARAAEAAFSLIYNLPLNAWRTYNSRIDAITEAQVQSFAQTYLDSSQAVSLTVGPS